MIDEAEEKSEIQKLLKKGSFLQNQGHYELDFRTFKPHLTTNL